jgi:hypothetical protein
MAMTAEERYNIALNIVARVGIEGDVIGEFSKAMSRLNAFSTMNGMEAQPIVPMTGQPTVTAPTPPTNDIGSITGVSQQGMM